MDRVTWDVERRMKAMSVVSANLLRLTWATSGTHVCERTLTVRTRITVGIDSSVGSS